MAGPEQDEPESKLTIESRSTERAHSTEHAADEEPITDINVTPLVDVALVLVIIFMAVSPFMLQAGLQVTESKSGAATGKAALSENVQLSLTKDGKISLNGQEVAPNDLPISLREAILKSKDGLVTVKADPENHVGQVVQVMDLAKQAGAKKVAILNDRKEEKKEAAPAAPAQ